MKSHSHSAIASYLFQEFTNYTRHYPAESAELSISPDTINILFDGLNDLAGELGHEQVLASPEIHALGIEFAYAIRNLFTDLNRSPNPLNSGPEHQRRVNDISYHESLARFYEKVTLFLNDAGVPLERGRTEFPLPTERQFPVLLKYVLDQDSDNNPVYSATEVEYISPGGKPVICFGGTSSFQGNTKVNAGIMQLAMDILGGEEVCNDGKVELYCVAYPARHRTEFFRSTHAYNAAPTTYYTDDAKFFCENMLIPQLTNKEGQLLPMLDLKKQCSRFNFFAYSYGTVFTQEVRNYLRDFFVDRHMATSDIQTLLANCYSMNLGPLCQLTADKEEGHFSSVHVISETDLSVRNKSGNMDLIRNSARMMPLRENEIIIRAAPPAKGIIKPDTFDELDPAPLLTQPEKVSKNPSGHSASFYARPVVDGDVVHNPRYIGFSMPDILGLPAAYRHLDGRHLPPRTPDATFSSTDGRITSYSAAVMNEVSRGALQALKP